MKKTIQSLLVLMPLGYIPSAYSQTLQIDFSGTFQDCYRCSSTTTDVLSTLVGTDFSGSLTMPTVASDQLPDDSSHGLYTFSASEASLRLNSTVDLFDIIDANPVSVDVFDCIDPFDSSPNCLGGGKDAVWISITAEPYEFYLIFSASYLGLDSDAIPSIDTLSTLWSGFEIITTDYSLSVNTGDIPISVTISAIPLPAAVWLFSSGVFLLTSRVRFHKT